MMREIKMVQVHLRHVAKKDYYVLLNTTNKTKIMTDISVLVQIKKRFRIAFKLNNASTS